MWRRALLEVDLNGVSPERYLDGLESCVTEVGWEAMRHLMVGQWRLTEEFLVKRFREEEGDVTIGDGQDRLKVASRLGVVYLPGMQTHTLLGKAGLPEHEGQVKTRGLQEWACLLLQDLSFGAAERLLDWMTHDPEVMLETQMRRWVCRHGQIIRQGKWKGWRNETAWMDWKRSCIALKSGVARRAGQLS